jgi:hypothetical protein
MSQRPVTSLSNTPAERDAPVPAIAVLQTPIELKGTFGLEQHVRVCRLTTTNVEIWAVAKSVAAIAIMIGLFAALGVYAAQPIWVIWLFAGGFGFFLVVVVSMLVLRRFWYGEKAIVRAFQSGRMRPVSVAWTVSDDGLLGVTESVKSREKWEIYSSIREWDDLILLYNRSSTAAVPFPKEFCQSEEEWERLRQFLRSRFPMSEGTTKDTKHTNGNER